MYRLLEAVQHYGEVRTKEVEVKVSFASGVNDTAGAQYREVGFAQARCMIGSATHTG